MAINLFSRVKTTKATRPTLPGYRWPKLPYRLKQRLRVLVRRFFSGVGSHVFTWVAGHSARPASFSGESWYLRRLPHTLRLEKRTVFFVASQDVSFRPVGQELQHLNR